MENIRYTEGFVVWSCEGVGRYLHYYPNLASVTLRHNDIIDSSLWTLTRCQQNLSRNGGGGANLLVGRRGGQIV